MTTLVTGADGYLARRLVARLLAGTLLAGTDDRFLLTVRTADRAALRREFGAAAAGRVEVVAVDLTDPEPFRHVDPAPVTRIVHAAARTAFTVDRPAAQVSNVDGTRRVAAFARRCPRLTRLLVLSTLFSVGRRVGEVTESTVDDGAGFANHYEWSKHEAERHLLATGADLPVSVARLATVVADDDTGAVGQYNAFHNTLKLLFYGLLPLLPGDPATPLYLATAEFVTAGLAHLARPDVPGGIYHLAPAPAEAIALGAAVDTVFDVFAGDAGYRRRRLLRPPLCDADALRTLVAASRAMSASPAAQALGSVAPFGEQLLLPKRFDNSRLRATWAGYRAVDARRLVENTCRRLVETRWGRSEVAA